MKEYKKRFGYVSIEIAIARTILATEIYRDYSDLIARAEKMRRFQRDIEMFSSIAELIEQLTEKANKVLALVGTSDEWKTFRDDPQILISKAIMAITETYGGGDSDLLFRVRDAKSLSCIQTDDLTDRQCNILANWRNYLYPYA